MFKYILAEDEEEQTEASDESQQPELTVKEQETEDKALAKTSGFSNLLAGLPLKIATPNLEDLQGALISSFSKLRSVLDRSQQSNNGVTESRDKRQAASSTSAQRDQTSTASTSAPQASEVFKVSSLEHSSSLIDICILRF